MGSRPRAGRLIAACATMVALVAPPSVAGATQPAVAQWTKVADPPEVQPRVAGLGSIVCRVAKSCIAVGSMEGLTGVPLVEIWDGTQWTQQSTPDLGAGADGGFGSVACATTTT